MDEHEMALRFDEATAGLGQPGALARRLPEHLRARAQEVRLRAGRPALVALAARDVYISGAGEPLEQPDARAFCVSRTQLDDIFRQLCDSSVYAHQHEIRAGFLTLRGGHRAGLCGTAVVQSGQVSGLRDLSGLSLRVAREVRGAADRLVPMLGGAQRRGLLLAGPPGCGKTTVLRDLARQLSTGAAGRCRVTVVDERGELAAMCRGVPQNDVGFCDVLDGYPKGEGILQAVRCLAPDVIICDEIGGEDDARAVAASLNAGVAVVASAHAGTVQELLARPALRAVLATGAFARAALLCGRDRPGEISACLGESDLHAAQADGAFGALWGMRDGRAFEIGRTFAPGTPA